MRDVVAVICIWYCSQRLSARSHGLSVAVDFYRRNTWIAVSSTTGCGDPSVALRKDRVIACYCASRIETQYILEAKANLPRMPWSVPRVDRSLGRATILIHIYTLHIYIYIHIFGMFATHALALRADMFIFQNDQMFVYDEMALSPSHPFRWYKSLLQKVFCQDCRICWVFLPNCLIQRGPIWWSTAVKPNLAAWTNAASRPLARVYAAAAAALHSKAGSSAFPFEKLRASQNCNGCSFFSGNTDRPAMLSWEVGLIYLLLTSCGSGNWSVMVSCWCLSRLSL